MSEVCDRCFGHHFQQEHGPRDIGQPWRLAPLDGRKHYGTKILDRQGHEVMRVWGLCGDASDREKAQHGDDWSDDLMYGGHYESQADFDYASEVIRIINAAGTSTFTTA